MPDFPEHDPELTPVLRTARRFLEWVRPSPDDPERPAPNERVDDLPQLRSTHVFVIKDDAIVDMKSRNDPTLSEAWVGTFDQHCKHLVELNTRHRAGIFIEVSARHAIVAEFDGAMARHGRGARIDMREALPAQPSITLSTGLTVPDRFVAETWVWLLTEPMPLKDQDALAGALEAYGATLMPMGKHLLRVPGFFNRSGKPFQVQCQGAAEFCGLRTIRHTPEALRSAFAPKPIDVDA